MIQSRTIGTLTELYVDNVGGVNTWITEAYPTNFHHKYKTRLLVGGEQISDYREVTADEMSAIEAADAAWVRPPQAVIDLWNNACIVNVQNRTKKVFGKYNEETGFFELNGLKDITYEEAIEILNLVIPDNRISFEQAYRGHKCRTFIGFNIGSSSQTFNFRWCFTGCKNLEILDFDFYWVNNLYDTFSGCTKLKRINGLITVSGTSNLYCAFTNCTSLEYVRLSSVKENVGFGSCPNLLKETLSWLISKAINTTAITITVHPNVYVKLTGDTTNAAAAALSDDELEAWMALVALAADKNINFATTT